MLASNTPDARALEIFQRSPAYVYVQAGTGVTGVKESVAPETVLHIARLKKLVKNQETSGTRLIVGFGISKPEQIKQIWKAGAEGGIVGSYFSSLIEENLQDLNLAKNKIKEFIKKLN